MRFEPASRGSECVALLDDMSPSATSRLYTRHAATLSIIDAADAPAAMDEVQRLLARGLHAVGVFTYELGARMQGMQAKESCEPLGRFLLFGECRTLREPQVVDWLRSRGGAGPSGVANVRASVTQAQFE